MFMVGSIRLIHEGAVYFVCIGRLFYPTIFQKRYHFFAYCYSCIFFFCRVLPYIPESVSFS